MNFKTPLCVSIFATLAVVISGCSSSGGSSGGSSSGLDGTWTTGCVLDDPEDPDEGYAITNLDISGGSATTSLFFYTDSACANPGSDPATAELGNLLTFPGGSVSTSLGEATFVNISFESVLFDGAPLSAELQNNLEQGGFFDPDFGIFLITSEGRLHFGDNDVDGQDGTSAEMRPQTIDTSEFFIRL